MLYMVLGKCLAWEFCFLVEIGESLEEAEDFWLREDVWEDAEVDAELLEAFRVHLETTIRVVLV